MSTLQARLETAMRLGQLERADLARACKISNAATSKWFSGKTQELKAEHAFKIARLCRVDAEWLATGRGNARPIAEPATPWGFEKKDLDLLRMFLRLHEDIQLPIRNMVQTLAAAHKERYASWSRRTAEHAQED